MSQEFIVKQICSLQDISADEWNRLSDNSNPFIRYEYLNGLEKHGCLENHGWSPCHVVVYSGSVLSGALPLYLRSNSYGEFVFDWAWADAYERAGGNYYPKLVTAIPFAPVIGPRLLVNPHTPSVNKIKQLLIEMVLQIAEKNNISSYHCLFTNIDEQQFFSKYGFMQRYTCQFHWHNNNYGDFQNFLNSLTSKKRKQIKRERARVEKSNIKISILTGEEISEEQWLAYYEFYCSTFYRRWGSPRLTLDFFRSLGKSMPLNTILILAQHRNTYIAGAFLMRGGDTLYGRHWGCNEQYPFLHFEICYYQAIEYCIKQNLKVLDAGVQGEHKLARGFRPVAANSYHWIQHPLFRDAVKKYLHQEKHEIEIYIENLNLHLPFKIDS